jgi:hypothetical protein
VVIGFYILSIILPLMWPDLLLLQEGSGANVLVASDPMDQWSSIEIDLNPFLPDSLYRTIAGQNSFAFQVTLADNTVEVMFVSDRWSSAPDGLKSHDLQYWQPLAFDDSLFHPLLLLWSGVIGSLYICMHCDCVLLLVRIFIKPFAV